MGVFERKRRELQEEGVSVIAASAQRLDLTDKGVARSYKKLQAQHAGWKAEAWRFYDELGEIWFGHNFVGNSLSRIRIFAAEESDTDEPPAAIDDLSDPARVEVERLENGDGISAMLHAMGIMMGVPGEGLLLGYLDPEDNLEKWGFYSCDQVFVNGNQKWALKRDPLDKTGIPLDPDTTVMVRLWRNHPRFRELSDSPMRPLLLLCDELQILSRTIRGAARSRLAGAGLLLWPQEAVPKPADETRQYAPGEIPFVQEWIEAAGTAIGDEASAFGVVPLFSTMPADYIEKVKHLDFNRPTDPIAAEQRKEIIQRISFGLDIPGEVLTGMAKTSHWTAWAIDEQTFKAHLEPLIISICGALTRGFLWPALRAHDLTEEELKTKIIWYDASGLLGHPNRAQDAKDAHTAMVISDDALRQHLGFSETDAPDDKELERRIAVAKGTLDPASLLLILQQVLTGVKVPEAPIPVAQAHGQVGQGATPIEATSSEPTGQARENQAPSQPTSDQPQGRSGIAAAATRVANRGRVLTAIDRELRARLLAATDTAVTRALERAGAKMRRKATAQVKGSLASIPQGEVLAFVGRDVATAFGVDEQAIIDEELANLQSEYDTQVQASQAQVRRLAAQWAITEPGQDDLAAAEQQQESDRHAGWLLLGTALSALMLERMFNPHPEAPPQGEHSTSIYVQPGLLRSSLARAGGNQAATDAAAASRQAMGQVATGPTALDLFRQVGLRTAGYTWVYGDPSSRHAPFEPHEELDGVDFTSFDDPVLGNNFSFPETDLLFPGDHDGCQCSFDVDIQQDLGSGDEAPPVEG